MWNQRRLREVEVSGFFGFPEESKLWKNTNHLYPNKYPKMVPDPPSPPMSLGVLAEFKPTSLRDGTLIFLESVAIRNDPSWNKWDRNHHKSSQTVGAGGIGGIMNIHENKWTSGCWFEPLWKIWKSVGVIIPNMKKKKKWSKPPTSIKIPPEKSWFTTMAIFHTLG